MAFDSVLWFIGLRAWTHFFACAGWQLWDGQFNLHPNILRGLQAAKELVLYRLRYPLPEEEPLILAVRATNPNSVGIPEILRTMKTNVIYPVYWLSLRQEAVYSPLPCYAATGEVLKRWKNGTLPRRAWGLGWWELEDETTRIWKRFDVNHRPMWSEYSEASKKIKILLKNYPRKFQAFLSVRDYGIDNEADQLIKMYKIFGEKHAACTAIWQGLFIKEAGAPRTRTKHEAPQWALYMIHLLRLEHLWDQVVSCMGLDGKLLELNERHRELAKRVGVL